MRLHRFCYYGLITCLLVIYLGLGYYFFYVVTQKPKPFINTKPDNDISYSSVILSNELWSTDGQSSRVYAKHMKVSSQRAVQLTDVVLTHEDKEKPTWEIRGDSGILTNDQMILEGHVNVQHHQHHVKARSGKLIWHKSNPDEFLLLGDVWLDQDGYELSANQLKGSIKSGRFVIDKARFKAAKVHGEKLHG
ncbi:MAG: LPS export ABC transporter periplasmic protein LptC [Pseudomonadota bacterium]|nr:LPS export ABC transporter periplasmic protein LptC [Pseudomonadota bacterium]